jgi:hypothetical protein
MAIKHRLAALVCAWDGHRPTPGVTMVCGSPYECVCCDRCRRVLTVANHPTYSPFGRLFEGVRRSESETSGNV